MTSKEEVKEIEGMQKEKGNPKYFLQGKARPNSGGRLSVQLPIPVTEGLTFSRSHFREGNT